MKAFLALFIFSILGQSYGSDKVQYLLKKIAEDETYYETRLSDAQKTEFKSSVENTAKIAFEERNSSEKEYPGWKPNELYDIYFENVNSIFLGGYATESNVNQWKLDFTNLKNTNLNLDANDNFYRNEVNQYNFYKQKYISIHQSFLDRMSSSPVRCAVEGEITGNKKCCSNHVRLLQKEESLPNRASCVKVKQQCSQNSQCCSGMCEKATVDGPGVCLAQTYCSEIRNTGNLCDDQNSICSTGQCINLDISEVNADNSCLNSKNVCQSNSDCCSNSCVNNRCVEVSKCMSCKKEGAALSQGESCCPGYIQMNGKCLAPMPVWAPTVQIQNIKTKHNIFEKITSIIFPKAHAAEGDSGISEAQTQLLAEKRANCDQSFVLGSEDHKICLSGVDSVEANYKEDRFTGLTQEQTDKVAAEREKCTSSHATGEDSHTACMKEVDNIEKDYLATNAKAGEVCLVHQRGSEAYKVCMAENGVMGISLGKQDYIDKYSIPGVTAKTYSNMKQCSFNSLNDSWRDASNKERNAEIFLRAFEYVFSHKGSEDYWVENGKGNLFTRANNVAVKFRENRAKMLAQMLEVDKTMACKCIAIFGPGKFSSLKQNFFNQNCEQEKIELQGQLGEDLGKGQAKGNVDGTSIAKLGSGVSAEEKKNAEIEEIDKGAIGLSHERLLVEWLQLRAEAQMLRFQTNSDLEEELEKLSEFISNVDFNEVFKDRIQGTALVESDPKGDSLLLFKWGYTYRPGWFKILNVLAFGVVGFVINNQMDFDKGSAGSGKAAVSHGMKAAWRYHEVDEIDAAPEIVDVKTKKKKCVKRVLGVCIKYMDGFHRYFIGPRFDNEVSEVGNRCRTKGRASTCFRAGYRTDLNGEINYIMDPTRPLFVKEEEVAINVMPGYSETFPQMLNKARDAGVAFLKSKEPGSEIKWGYKNGGDSFGNQDHIGEAITLGHFLPEKGNLIIKKSEEEGVADIKSAIKRGAAKYAMCKSLKEDCGVSTIQDPEVIGFGYLFEVQSEAQVFSDYVYEIHWKWSHLTKNNFMGYPLLGMDSYFKLVAYNMKLVGSFAAARSVQYAEAFQKYNIDFEERLGEYNSLGEAGAGTKSRNLKYGEQFFKVFGKLDFSGESNIEAFDAAMNSANASGEFNTAEVSALSSGRASAIRRNNDIKRQDDFKKAVSSSNKTAQKAFKKNNAFFEKVNSPLNSFGLSKFGGSNKGLRGLTNAINNMNGNIKDLNKGGPGGTGSRHNSTFTMPKMPSYNASSNRRGNVSGDSNLSSGGSLQDSGMSKTQINSLLKNLDRSKQDLEPNKDDTIFSIVSKAYKRNYSRVLRRSTSAKVMQGREEPAKINDKDKSELKDLLEAN